MSLPPPPADIAVPRSIAIIMDGNGRWARQRGFERIKGHEHGARAVRETVEESVRLGIEAVTLYAFSEENWVRPRLEIELLMKLLKRFLIDEQPGLMENNIRLVHSGRRERLAADVLKVLDETIAMTAGNTGMTLCLAISYGGRAEIVDAARSLAEQVKAGDLDPADIDEELFQKHLYCPDLPDPDLLIRTAGEMRVSNFLLWEISYAEIHVAEVCWPEFRREHLWEALRDYGKRVRKFGSVVH